MIDIRFPTRTEVTKFSSIPCGEYFMYQQCFYIRIPEVYEGATNALVNSLCLGGRHNKYDYFNGEETVETVDVKTEITYRHRKDN